MANIILASKSDRRQELLKRITSNFKVEVANIDETINTDNNLKDELKKVALKKAKVIFEKNRESVVIGSDTIVVLNNQVLIKPKDKNDARNILTKLSNNTHFVYTAVAIISNKEELVFVDESSVKFVELSDLEIENYINTNEPYDKAGAYGIQGQGGLFIESIVGDYYSIMGLPISKVYQHLKKYL